MSALAILALVGLQALEVLHHVLLAFALIFPATISLSTPYLYNIRTIVI
jgi:hypothetical protein